MINKKTIEKLEAIQDYQERIYYGAELTDEQKVIRDKSIEKAKQLADILFVCIEHEYKELQEFIYDRLQKSILEGGTVRFYHPYANYLINEAKTIEEFSRIRSENSVEAILVFVRPDGTAIPKDEPLNHILL